MTRCFARRFGVRIKIGIAAAITLGTCGIGWASYEYDGEPPAWDLEDPAYNPGGSAGLLLPSNDTRVNLYLLLADRRGAPLQVVKPDPKDAPTVLFPWRVMAAQASPPNGEETDQDALGGSRCQTRASGAQAFNEAVQSSAGVPDTEKRFLMITRQDLKAEEEWNDGNSDCTSRKLPDFGNIQSAAGKEFAAYLLGAETFYAGQFDQAAQQFGSLKSATQPWVRETANYMVARTLLNRASAKSLDEYGSLVEPKKRDVKAAALAGAALDAYLSAYPAGRYANSARGLIRRVHWLAGDERALAADYEQRLSNVHQRHGLAPTFAVIAEIDQKLWPLRTRQRGVIHDPLLLAVTDLQRMRKPWETGEDGEKVTRAACCGPTITKADIEAQRQWFGNDAELYDYLLAAQAYFVRHQPREVLRLIPDAAQQKRFSYVQFSRQMLRGFALQAVRDPNSRDFWISLFPGAVEPYQHGAVELALAIQEEKSGRLDLIFAPGSPVQHPVIRQLLLEQVAGPALLRQQASRPGVSKIERDDAFYTLLFKDISRGFYPDFVRDVRLLPAASDFVPDASNVEDKGFTAGANYDPEIHTVPLDNSLDIFRSDDPIGNFGCPTLIATVTTLAANPRAVRPRLCIAEYFRTNFDGGSSGDEAPDSGKVISGIGLASSRPQFPTGTPYSRLEIYKSIIRDPAATPDDKALALNRAIWCYGPSGNNECGGIEVPVAQRRAWFVRLKTRYADSRWAKELKYFW